MINIFQKKKKEDEVPTNWATPQPVAAPMPPKWGFPKRLNRMPVWAAKLFFFIYLAMCVGCYQVAPIGILLFLPTAFLMVDYLRKDKKLRELTGWWVKAEDRDSAGEGRAEA